MNIKKVTLAGVLLSVMLMLTGCGITNGTITEKTTYPAYTYVTYIKVGEVQVPQFNTVPTRYCFALVNPEGATGEQCVENELYNSLDVGDYYTTER